MQYSFRTFNFLWEFEPDFICFIVNLFLCRHCDECSILGFDCEWVIDRWGVRQNVALVQLASHRGLCVLIRLCEFGMIPLELQVHL